MDSLAYVIYTSGSTGRPRGVLVPQRAVVNHNLDFVLRYGLSAGDRVLQFASISFDTAAEEIFPTLLSGATLVLRAAEASLSLADFLAWMDRRSVTVVDLPTAYWHFWVSESTRHGTFLAGVASLGDRRRRESVARSAGCLARAGRESGQLEQHLRSDRDDDSGNDLFAGQPAGIGRRPPEMRPSDWKAVAVPIGRPNTNVTVYLLDAREQPVPIGVPGEIWVGGVGVTRGYHDQPELTAARFATLTVQPGRPQRLYRSGDLARWLPDGNLDSSAASIIR